MQSNERRIMKFRAWDKYNERWLNISSIAIGFRGMVEGVWDLDGELYGLHQVDLIFYTGLRDKNGTEIYEGDIVTHPLCVKEPHDADEPCGTFIGHIQFEVDRGQWFAANAQRNGYVIVMTEAYKFEVIGNIHENKELLK